MKEIKKEQLNNVNGGFRSTKNDLGLVADVLCAITYISSGVQEVTEVTLSVPSVDNKVSYSAVADAAVAWCDQNMYQYVSHQILQSDGYFVFW